MMGKLRDFQKKVSKIKEADIERGILKIIKSEEALLVDANTGQLMRGEDSNGDEVNPPYRSKFYSEFKLHLNPLGIVDLNLTGAFHAKFKLVTSRGWPAYLYSNDRKTPELVAKYGKEIFGVQQETLGDITQSSFKPAIQDYYRRDLFEL